MAADVIGSLATVARSDGAAGGTGARDGRFQCPYCNSYEVARMFLASVNLDSCECTSCGARWDEDCGSGAYKGRGNRASVLMPRPD